MLTVTTLGVPYAAATSSLGGAQGANLPAAVVSRGYAAPAAAGVSTGTGAIAPTIDTSVKVRNVAPNAKPPKTKTELTDRRGMFTNTYANPNGTRTTEVSSERVNYKDSSGAWQPIDSTLVSDSGQV